MDKNGKKSILLSVSLFLRCQAYDEKGPVDHFLVTQAKSQSSCSNDNRYRGESDRPVIEFPSCLVNDKLFEDIHHRRMIGIF